MFAGNCTYIFSHTQPNWVHPARPQSAVTDYRCTGEGLQRCMSRDRRNNTFPSDMLGGQGADLLRGVAFSSISASSVLRWFCMTGAALRMTWAHCFVPGAILQTHGLERSQNILARGRQLCTRLSIFEGSLAELLRFWCCQFLIFVGFMFCSVSRPASASASRAAATHNFVTRHLSHTIFHTQLCHTPSFTHNFVTHYLSHTIFHTQLCHTQLCHTPSFTHNFVTHYLSHTIFHTQLCHTQLCHIPSFTHNFVTHYLSHTIFHTQLCHTPSFTHNFVTHYLSHTIFHTQLCHTQLCHIPSFTHNFVTHYLSHTIFHTQLCHIPSFTHNFVTHYLSHTIFHTLDKLGSLKRSIRNWVL